MAKQQQVAAVQANVHARNVANNQVVRMLQRIAQVQQLRASKNAARAAAKKQQAFIAAVQQAAAQYGVDPSMLLRTQQVAANARANSATVAPSRELVHVAGVGYTPCAAVHALCATLPANATRAEQLQLCKDNGINPATASTQVGKYRAQAKAAAAAQA